MLCLLRSQVKSISNRELVGIHHQHIKIALKKEFMRWLSSTSDTMFSANAEDECEVAGLVHSVMNNFEHIRKGHRSERACRKGEFFR
jgi:hypothetical protein